MLSMEAWTDAENRAFPRRRERLCAERLGQTVNLADHLHAVNTDESVIWWTGRNAKGKHTAH